MYTIETLQKERLDSAYDYLHKNENLCMFLLSNLDRFGPYRTEHPYSGNYKLIRKGEQIVGIFCICVCGTLLLHTDTLDTLCMEKMYEECILEFTHIKCIIAPYDKALALFSYFSKLGLVLEEGLHLNEIVYSIDLRKVELMPTPVSRLLQAKDYTSWKALRNAYVYELKLPLNLTEDEELLEFERKVDEKILWGTFQSEQLLSIADLNAKTKEIAQLGSVFTLPSYRNKGLATKTVQKALFDCNTIHAMRKMVIFTDRSNIAARKIYESLGASFAGYLGILCAI